MNNPEPQDQKREETGKIKVVFYFDTLDEAFTKAVEGATVFLPPGLFHTSFPAIPNGVSLVGSDARLSERHGPSFRPIFKIIWIQIQLLKVCLQLWWNEERQKYLTDKMSKV